MPLRLLYAEDVLENGIKLPLQPTRQIAVALGVGGSQALLTSGNQ
jgi:hypothetical protein